MAVFGTYLLNRSIYLLVFGIVTLECHGQVIKTDSLLDNRYSNDIKMELDDLHLNDDQIQKIDSIKEALRNDLDIMPWELDDREKLLVKDVLNSHQYSKYLRIKDNEKKSRRLTEILTTKDQYSFLNISNQQAERIFDYQTWKIRMSTLSNKTPSLFDELSDEIDFMQELLSESQFPIYLENKKRETEFLIQDMIDQDTRKKSFVDQKKRLLNYDLSYYLPLLREIAKEVNADLNEEERQLIKKLKAVYQDCIDTYQRKFHRIFSYYYQELQIINERREFEINLNRVKKIPDYEIFEFYANDSALFSLFKDLSHRLNEHISHLRNENKEILENRKKIYEKSVMIDDSDAYDFIAHYQMSDTEIALSNNFEILMLID